MGADLRLLGVWNVIHAAKALPHLIGFRQRITERKKSGFLVEVRHYLRRIKSAVKQKDLRLRAKLWNFLASNSQHVPGVRMRAGEETRVSLNTISVNREKRGTDRRRWIVETQFV